MSSESRTMNRDKLIVALQQIRAIVDEVIGEVGHEKRGRKKPAARVTEHAIRATDVSFSMNVLAFMNKYARGLKGPRKFALLLARLVKGNVSQQVTRAELESHWNKMKVVLGGRFNPVYPNRAKAKGWVDSPKHGVYTLSDSWKECLTRK